MGSSNDIYAEWHLRALLHSLRGFVVQACGYSAGQAAKIVGLAYHQLNHWARLGVVVPSVDEGKGYDGVRAYSFLDLVALKVVAELKSAGLPLRQLASVAENVQKWGKAVTPTYLVGSADGNVSACEEKGLLSTLRSVERKGLSWFLNISEIVVALRTSAAEAIRPSRGKGARVA